MPIYKNKNGDGFIVKVNYTDSNGKHKQILRCSKATLTKADAKKVEQELLTQIALGNTDDKNPTFEELYNEFILVHAQESKASTLRGYKSAIPLYVLPYFKDIKIKDITKKQIVKWKYDIQSKNLSIITKNNIYKYFNAILNYACKVYDLPKNYLNQLGRFKDQSLIKEDKIQYWTYDEFKKFQYALRIECDFKKNESQLRWYSSYCFFNILFFAGLRKGEANALKWSDLVNINGVWYLDINKSINQKVTPYEITPPKNKTSIRKVPVCDELLEILLEQKERCRRIVYFDEKLFYICGTVTPISDSAESEIKIHFAKMCNLPNIRIHDFRHSYCSMLINGGLPLSTIASLMGHSTIEITQKVYNHMYPEQNIQVLKYMNSLKK